MFEIYTCNVQTESVAENIAPIAALINLLESCK